ncbi:MULTISPECIES: GNAT family N-acetyltransferase [unclassified Ruegeria]|uniref:GNAT family N-acetyltransferase n=1 Tax=unclassified Ruegeria TaxID=2625375 RepID=UPI00148858F4|nr:MULTISPECIES: GNAT family N-acetyltransferase [unclassified Ruegeria]NOD34662.1 GNAT family N-acetyltransferase [Ruegeria sp. HKCCD7296]NOE41868.1 GNAT family N-acetyltransferase [Ruegeria sp. HKCCD7319]
MKVRPARPADALAIAEIANQIIRETLVTFTTDTRSAESIAEDIRARGPGFLVAEIEGRVVGFATFGPFRSGPGYAHSCEHSIQLAPEARGQGVGRALMVALEKAARAKGVHVLVAGISSANPSAVAFHAALGFEQVGVMPQIGYKWGQWLDLVLMQKILSPD